MHRKMVASLGALACRLMRVQEPFISILSIDGSTDWERRNPSLTNLLTYGFGALKSVSARPSLESFDGCECISRL